MPFTENKTSIYLHNNTEIKMKNIYTFIFHFLWSTKSTVMSFYHKNHRDMHNSDQHLECRDVSILCVEVCYSYEGKVN